MPLTHPLIKSYIVGVIDFLGESLWKVVESHGKVNINIYKDISGPVPPVTKTLVSSLKQPGELFPDSSSLAWWLSLGNTTRSLFIYASVNAVISAATSIFVGAPRDL